jgi:hypothetical protein
VIASLVKRAEEKNAAVIRGDMERWSVHRHADPLVQRITLQQAAVLARGWPEEK